MSISKTLRYRLTSNGIPFNGNDNISEVFEKGDLELLQLELEEKYQEILDILLIDTKNDPNTKETAKRVSKMMIQETFAGRYNKMPSITDFPNARELDELYTVGPITINTTCSHHVVPIVGRLWVGIHPSKRVIGLSKFHRLATWAFCRFHIQEDATVIFADLLEKVIAPQGLAVIFKAKHMCCAIRGVKDIDTVMTTSVVRGSLREHMVMKAEFLQLISPEMK